ncbi:MAG TPA: MarR family transcriptional regulator [Caulobacteraceae bacterium]|nr:MarR family transcriptional regulator [Caulobacteraceae bacterium]
MADAALELDDKLGGGPPDGRRSLRLWLRLLTCTALVERRVSARLRETFDTTLPRFDFLAALERAGPEGLPLGEVSRSLLITNGAVTGLAARLKEDGLIEPCESADRRFQRVRLSETGARRFAEMAAAHRRWVEALFADLDEAETDRLMTLLDRAKRSVQSTDPEELIP